LAEERNDPHLLADALARLATAILDDQPRDAVALYERARRLFTEVGDRYGQVRCHVNIGVAYSRAGDGRAAEEAFEVALELGDSAHAPDLTGLATLNLGALYLKGGRYEHARERLEQGLRLFAAVRHETHRLVTLYNLAHLERETGNATAALERYAASSALARSLGKIDIDIGAIAGAGLLGLSLGDRRGAERALNDADQLTGARADWWFQGRELVETLRVRLAAQRGETAVAERSFRDALALAEAHDPFGAAWLVAECAASLDSCCTDLAPTIARHARRVEAMGYGALAPRYASLATQASR
jgi:tetratricopeptide (TPR) repeat protein